MPREQLLSRAQRLYEDEKTHRTVDESFLIALSAALVRREYRIVNQLVTAYDCGQTL